MFEAPKVAAARSRPISLIQCGDGRVHDRDRPGTVVEPIRQARLSDQEATKVQKQFRRPTLEGDKLTAEDCVITEEWLRSKGGLGD